MMKKYNSSEVNRSFELGSIRTVVSFAQVPLIAIDRLRQNPAAMTREPREKKWRLWMPRRFRVARGV